MNRIKDSIQTIKGIGPKKAALFKKLGIETLEDVLAYFPRKYEYRGAIQKVASVQEGMVSLLLEFDKAAPRVNRIRRGFSTTVINGYDQTGKIECIWFNQPYRTSRYEPGKKYYAAGKAVKRPSGMQLQNPVIEEYDPEYHGQPRYLPVYTLTAGLTQREARHLAGEALRLVLPDDGYMDEMDAYITQRYGLIKRAKAIREIHFPGDMKAHSLARQRLAFEEFLQLQLCFRYIRNSLQKGLKGIVISTPRKAVEEFLSGLPFRLTYAQEKVLNEVIDDMSGGSIMNRLIQGDVGSGKTVISAAALYFAARAGYQGAMMVPTEILAKQHFESLSRMMSNTGITLGLLTGSMKESEKQEIKQALRNGEIQILTGTHAIIQEDVEFSRLGLVVTDEQHRFGVRQRALLQKKGTVPHMLVMSATPIPRTLAHIIHGDLDLSVIDTLPPGRTPVKTYHVNSSYRQRIYRFVRKHAEEGLQAYVVCPLVEESEKMELRSAEEVYKELSEGILKGMRIGLLHGRQKPEEKECIMEEFAKGSIKVLISTTVIEVGINVPNAVIMVVENAERFGLAQLHQLRGRVGRGDKPSYCILVSDINDEIGLERLKVLVESNDGFEIAEKDLELRGPGDLYGLRQHGLPQFRIANPVRDHDLLYMAREAAKEILDNSDNHAFREYIRQALEQQSRIADIPAAN